MTNDLIVEATKYIEPHTGDTALLKAVAILLADIAVSQRKVSGR